MLLEYIVIFVLSYIHRMFTINNNNLNNNALNNNQSRREGYCV
jgi:hypothetical protein